MARTIDEEFNDSYAESGMQPSVGYRPPMRSVQIEYKNKSKNTTRGVRNTTANKPQQDTTPHQTKENSSSLKSTRSVERTFRTNQEVTTISRQQVRKIVNPKQVGRDLKGVVRASRANLSIFGWAGWAWLWLQLPMAILSIAFFGLSAMFEELKNNFSSNPLGKLVVWGVTAVFKTVNALSTALLGFDFKSLDPMNFFLLTQTVVFFIGIATLIAMGIIYLVSGVHCFFGKGTILKISTFIIALCGYTFPFLNLFPWFIFWALAVWRYPK